VPENRSPETESIATEIKVIATPPDFDATEIKLIAPMTKSIGPEIKFDASDRSENGTLTDFIGPFR
jgi:hypothetical protein